MQISLNSYISIQDLLPSLAVDCATSVVDRCHKRLTLYAQSGNGSWRSKGGMSLETAITIDLLMDFIFRLISLLTKPAAPAWWTSVYSQLYRIPQTLHPQVRLCKAARSDGWARNSSIPKISVSKTVAQQDIRIATRWEWWYTRLSAGVSHFTKMWT